MTNIQSRRDLFSTVIFWPIKTLVSTMLVVQFTVLFIPNPFPRIYRDCTEDIFVPGEPYVPARKRLRLIPAVYGLKRRRIRVRQAPLDRNG